MTQRDDPTGPNVPQRSCSCWKLHHRWSVFLLILQQTTVYTLSVETVNTPLRPRKHPHTRRFLCVCVLPCVNGWSFCMWARVFTHTRWFSVIAVHMQNSCGPPTHNCWLEQRWCRQRAHPSMQSSGPKLCASPALLRSLTSWWDDGKQGHFKVSVS